MANKDTEIEIKIKLDENDFLRIKKELDQIANYQNTSFEIDQYLTPTHRDFMKPKRPNEWLRLRKKEDKTSICYKHFYPEDAEIKTHCDEYETQIQDFEQINKILKALDFQKIVIVEKKRTTYNYNQEFEIGMDEVKELGHYIEIESIKDFGSVELTRQKLFEFAKKLNLDTSKAEKVGYPYLLMQKK